MRYQIKNFVEGDPVVVECWLTQNKNQPLVTLSQHAGSMNLSHLMTPEQARFMSASLSLAADKAEALARASVLADSLMGVHHD